MVDNTRKKSKAAEAIQMTISQLSQHEQCERLERKVPTAYDNDKCMLLFSLV